jgi:hypothetical protein
MALAINGFEILGRISNNAELFRDVRLDVAKTAQAFVEKQLKAKSTDITVLRNIRDELGKDNFDLVVECMKDAPIKTLLGRLDKFHPELKKSDATWRRRHLIALAGNTAEPTPKPEPVKKTKPTSSRRAKAAAPTRLSSEVFDALKRRG